MTATSPSRHPSGGWHPPRTRDVATGHDARVASGPAMEMPEFRALEAERVFRTRSRERSHPLVRTERGVESAAPTQPGSATHRRLNLGPGGGRRFGVLDG